MFTWGTQHFGIWRESHNTRRRYCGMPTQGFLIALGTVAFVGWFIYFLCLKIRGEYFLFESNPVKLLNISNSKTNNLILKSRPVSFSVAVFALNEKENKEENSFQFVFSNGETYKYPKDEQILRKFIQTKSESFEFFSMLMMREFPESSRLQIWPEASLNYKQLKEIIHIFSKYGFDDFDIAVNLMQEG